MRVATQIQPQNESHSLGKCGGAILLSSTRIHRKHVRSDDEVFHRRATQIRAPIDPPLQEPREKEQYMGQAQASSPDAPRPPESQATGPPPGRPGRAAAPAPRGAPPAAPPRPAAAPPPRCHWRRRVLPPSPEPRQRPEPPLGFCAAAARVFLGRAGAAAVLTRAGTGIAGKDVRPETENGLCGAQWGEIQPPSNTGPGGSGLAAARMRNPT